MRPVPQSGSPSDEESWLVGREWELAAVVERLGRRDPRLLTLTGPAGVGKTRLAVAAAEALSSHFADGALFVDLAAVQGWADVLPTIARVLGLRDHGGLASTTLLRRYLSGRELLLVLDTFEHVLQAAFAIAGLLASCPSLSVLVTSRAPLALRQEQQVVVGPLTTPDPGPPAVVSTLAAIPSVALFAARAKAADPSFALSDDNASAVADICRRLQGIPLAIDLAAAQLRTLSVPALRARLEASPGGLDVLVRERPSRPERHRSLESAIDWSYRLLEADEQSLLRELSIFENGVELEDAVAISAVDRADERLQGLVELSLLEPIRGSASMRFRMLDATRAYARRRLPQAQAESVRRRHAAWMLRLAELAEAALWRPEQARWLRRLDRGLNDILGAARWAAAVGDVETAVRLPTALADFWWLRGHLNAGQAVLEHALSRFPEAPTHLRAPALMANGFLAAAKGDYVAARAQVSTGLALAKAGGLVELLGRGYLRLATIELEVGDWSAAEAALDRALPRLVDANDGVSGAYVARCLAEIAFHRGDHAGAESLFASAIRQLERLSDLWSIAATRGSKLAPLRFMSGDVDKGLDEIAQALVIARDLDDAYLIHRTITAAISLLPLSAPESLLQILNGLQELRARLDVLEHPWFGIARLPGATSDREPELRAALEGRLDAVSVARAAAAGRRMSAAALADATLELLVARRARASATAVERGTHLPELPMAASQLSTRERQVMTLVAEGLSSRVIATRLEIAETTVKRHVASARRKLGAENRAQAAVLALEQDGP